MVIMIHHATYGGCAFRFDLCLYPGYYYWFAEAMVCLMVYGPEKPLAGLQNLRIVTGDPDPTQSTADKLFLNF